MPCGRMSIASRNRSCDLRASTIAASAAARLRTISPISAETRRPLPESFGLGFAGRPGMRAIALSFSLLVVFGRIFGIARPTRILHAMFSDKYLKNWYLLPVPLIPQPGSGCPLKGRTHVMRVASHEVLGAD